MIVVDASVVAKWFLPEAGTEQALALIDGALPLAAPSLIRLEVHGAITRRNRLSELREEEATVLCGKWAQRLKQGVMIPFGARATSSTGPTTTRPETSPHAAFPIACTWPRPNSGPFPWSRPIRSFHKRAVKHYPDTHLLTRWKAN